MKITHAFQCTVCCWHNYPRLNLALTGNYTIQCGNPACQHHHYRVVEDGRVTEDRHSSRYGESELIHVMPSACQQEPRVLGKVAQFRQLVVAGLAR